MKHGEKIAPVAAALTGLATLACCLPVGFAAAAVTAGLSTMVAAYQPWFLAASVVLLAVGLVQLNQVQRTCSRRPYESFVVFGVSAVIVLLAVLFRRSLRGCSRIGCLDVHDESTTNVRVGGVGDRLRGGAPVTSVLNLWLSIDGLSCRSTALGVCCFSRRSCVRNTRRSPRSFERVVMSRTRAADFRG
jgi:hypothetical protein